MNKGTSVQRPDLITYRNKRLQVRFNITETTVDHGNDGTMAQFNYNYVEVPQPIERKKIIVAMVRSFFDIDDEFALMNLDPQDTAYIEYRAHVEKCKLVADEVVEEVAPTVIQPVTDANTVAEIKTYLDLLNIDYLSTDLKADLLARI